jgi:hypothetical protein
LQVKGQPKIGDYRSNVSIRSIQPQNIPIDGSEDLEERKDAPSGNVDSPKNSKNYSVAGSHASFKSKNRPGLKKESIFM